MQLFLLTSRRTEQQIQQNPGISTAQTGSEHVTHLLYVKWLLLQLNTVQFPGAQENEQNRATYSGLSPWLWQRKSRETYLHIQQKQKSQNTESKEIYRISKIGIILQHFLKKHLNRGTCVLLSGLAAIQVLWNKTGLLTTCNLHFPMEDW